MKFFKRVGTFISILPFLFFVLVGACVRMDTKDFNNSVYLQAPNKADYNEDMSDFPHPHLKTKPPFSLPESGPLELSIEQTIMLAIQNNRDLQVLQFNPVIAGTFEQIELGEFDPEIFADLQYFEERASEISRSTGEQFDVEGIDSFGSLGIRQKLPTGTTFEATVDHNRSTSNRTPEQQTARLGLNVTQSLLKGFGPAVNLAQVRQAEMETLASLYELRGFTETLLANTEISYWNFLLAGKQIKIFQQSLELAKQQRDEVELRIEVGLLPEVEAAAARSEVSRREQALIEARSSLEENRLKLLRLISPHPKGQLDLLIHPISEPLTEPEPITDLEDRLKLAELYRADLREAKLRLGQNRLETIVTRNGLLPRLDLFISLGKTGFENSFSESFRELDGDTYDFTAGIRLSQFIGNRVAKGRDLAARASRRQAAKAVDNLQELVQVDVMLAMNELERARQQISASRATRILQEETLKAEEERFDVGASVALLVAQAQRDLLQSRIAEVEAIINYRIALVELFLAEGSLLERRGVSLDFNPYSGFQPVSGMGLSSNIGP